MTTDTFPKASTRTAEIGGVPVRITGIAKGSGMIAPDMATMLCFVFTDAAIPAAAMQTMLQAGVDETFNCITVDSDTSPATRCCCSPPARPRTRRAPRWTHSARRYGDVLLDLALQVIRDGEGAQKLIRIDVTGAQSDASAKRIGMAVANSPLVKTAVGRRGRQLGPHRHGRRQGGEPADRDRLSIGVGGTWMARNGTVVEGYDETPVVAHMKGHEIEVAIDLGLGAGKATVWTCDLTHGYIDINGKLPQLRPDEKREQKQGQKPQGKTNLPAPANGPCPAALLAPLWPPQMPSAPRRRQTPFTPPPDLEPLTTERLILRPPIPEDAEQLHRLVNDWGVVRMLSRLPFPYPRTLTDEWIASTIDQRVAGTGYHLVITGQEDGQELVIGCVGLRLDLKPRTGNLGYWVGRRYWGHGVATEAAGRVARWALANLQIDRIEAHVAEDNPPPPPCCAGSACARSAPGPRPSWPAAARTRCSASRPRARICSAPSRLPPTDPAHPGQPAAAGGRLRADRHRQSRAARPPAGGQEDGRGCGNSPAARLQPVETPERALIRELKEELGIDVAQACLAPFAFASHDYERFHMLMRCSSAAAGPGPQPGWRDRPSPGSWPNKLTDYEMPPADKPLIPLLRDFL